MPVVSSEPHFEKAGVIRFNKLLIRHVLRGGEEGGSLPG